MPGKSNIAWTSANWNPVVGCSKVSTGCRNCYAINMAHRIAATGNQNYAGLTVLENGHLNWTGEVRCLEDRLDWPLRQRKPMMIFVNSMSDLFHEKVPLEFIAEVFDVMASATANCGKRHVHEEECWCGDPHIFQVLTKRPDRMRKIMCEDLPFFIGEQMPGDSALAMADWPLPNVWLGVSCEDQPTADERIPLLLQTPAAVRWISAEPLLGEIDLSRWMECTYAGEGFQPVASPGINPLSWIVCGGESGPKARPMQIEWVRSLRDQCSAAHVPFFFKQGSQANWPRFRDFDTFPDDLKIREYPTPGEN